MRANWRRALYASLAVAALLPIPALGQTDSDRRLSRTEAVKAAQTLTAWLECSDCGQASLKRVTAYGQSVVPSLAATLSGGLSPATRETMHQLLATRYDELEAQAQKQPKLKLGSKTKQEFIDRNLESYDAQHRIRAAQALAAIGGANARSALETALGTVQRADVRNAIQQSLKEIR